MVPVNAPFRTLAFALKWSAVPSIPGAESYLSISKCILTQIPARLLLWVFGSARYPFLGENRVSDIHQPFISKLSFDDFFAMGRRTGFKLLAGRRKIVNEAYFVRNSFFRSRPQTWYSSKTYSKLASKT